MRFRFAFILCVFLIVALSAAVPRLINYQGRLSVEATGDPIPDGTYNITFHLYDSETGGSLLWSENYSSLSVENGLYAVLLGSRNPFPSSIDFAGQYWLEVELDTTTFTPRYELGSSPYALRAAIADSVPGTAIAGGEGVVNYIPIWLDSCRLGSSNIYNTTGHIGMQKDVNISYKLTVDTILSVPSDTLYLPEIVLVNELVTDSIEAKGEMVKIRDDVHVEGVINVDGQIISTIAPGTPPIYSTSTTRCENLNADMVDGYHANELLKKEGFYIAPGGGTASFAIPHYNVCTVTIGEAYGAPQDIAFLHIVENDSRIAWVGYKSESGTMTQVGGTALLSSTDVILTLGGGSITLQCPGDGSYSLDATSTSQDVRGMVIW